MKEKLNEVKVEANGKGIITIAGTILILTFILGWSMCSKTGGNVVFTKADMEAINTAMSTYGDNITVEKDKYENLILNLGNIDK